MLGFMLGYMLGVPRIPGRTFLGYMLGHSQDTSLGDMLGRSPRAWRAPELGEGWRKEVLGGPRRSRSWHGGPSHYSHYLCGRRAPCSQLRSLLLVAFIGRLEAAGRLFGLLGAQQLGLPRTS